MEQKQESNWWNEFQKTVLKVLPRDISRELAESYVDNFKLLERRLREALLGQEPSIKSYISL